MFGLNSQYPFSHVAITNFQSGNAQNQPVFYVPGCISSAPPFIRYVNYGKPINDTIL